MATRFRSFEALCDALADDSFDRRPAFVANAHVTGMGVARALAKHDVPVIALDRVGDGVAPSSEAVDFAGGVTYPLNDVDAFGADLMTGVFRPSDPDPARQLLVTTFGTREYYCCC